MQAWRYWLVALALLSCWRVKPVLAQSILPAADGTGTQIQHDDNTYTITGGRQAGANLFHSFQQLGLSASEIANFLADPSIQNILGRVTGGDPSIIEGLLRVSGSEANLFLMNPAGWVFAEGAALDLGGSFTATSATSIGFAGGVFKAFGNNDYAALSGNPINFAFDVQAGAILNQADLGVREGRSLWLVGNSVLSTGTLNAPGGNITISAVPGQNQLRIRQDGALLELVLDAVPLANDDPIASIGLRAADLPRYLTGELETVRFNDGDVRLNGTVAAETIAFVAAGAVTPSQFDQVQGETTVVRLPSENEALTYTFIDARADNPHQLLYGGAPGTISRLIDRDTDGLAAIATALDAVETELEAITIVAEGNAGDLWLGNTWLTSENLPDYAAQLQRWAGSLTAKADLLLYSCFTALGEVGQAFVNQFAKLTGADVAASTNATGSANYGGDWQLEFSTGNIEAGNPFRPEMLANWDGKLATLTVTDFADSGPNTLRGQIAAAAAGDDIHFAGSGTINLGSAISWGTDNLTIDGGGQAIAIDGSAIDRIFNVSADRLTLRDLTLQNGSSAGNGGGINHNSFGTSLLRLENVTITGNSSGNFGGGIFSNGTVELSHSNVAGNSAANAGGGILAQRGISAQHSTISGNSANSSGGGLSSNGNIALTQTTVSGNTSAFRGGGIFANGTLGGSVQLTNATVSGNFANNNGGGIFSVNAPLELTNATVAFNTVATGDGGGIFVQNNLAHNVANSLIARNADLNGGAPDIDADFGVAGTSVQFSLIQDTTGIAGLTLTNGVNGNVIGQDPLLSPLADNGGPTQTHAIAANSPALDAGSNALALDGGGNPLNVDQRGYSPRFFNSTVDIGAFEFGATATGIVTTAASVTEIAATATALDTAALRFLVESWQFPAEPFTAICAVKPVADDRASGCFPLVLGDRRDLDP